MTTTATRPICTLCLTPLGLVTYYNGGQALCERCRNHAPVAVAQYPAFIGITERIANQMAYAMFEAMKGCPCGRPTKAGIKDGQCWRCRLWRTT